MKKIYKAPTLEIEVYRLDASIAGNCQTVVDMGPDMPGAIKVCDSYYEEMGMPRPYSANIDFWNEATCDCYYSANGTFFTS